MARRVASIVNKGKQTDMVAVALKSRLLFLTIIKPDTVSFVCTMIVKITNMRHCITHFNKTLTFKYSVSWDDLAYIPVVVFYHKRASLSITHFNKSLTFKYPVSCDKLAFVRVY